ncbi:hypothetical protein M758_12G018500 [Ceratodon purpureus]|nr:hypothetical protein M758_12G018500 [Ceratodon purpureus]
MFDLQVTSKRLQVFSRWVVMGQSNPIIALWQAALLGVWGMAAAVEGRELWSQRMKPCSPPLFVFGASYMDVGENAAAMPFREGSEREPYGLDYFDGKPTGRYSNGRVITDHISQGLGQDIMSPYLRDMGTGFRHGVNFASSGSTARNSSFIFDGSNSGGLFSLSIQVDQFRVFHKQALKMYQLKKDTAGRLPAPEDFPRGVYIIETGNNDYNWLHLDQNDEALISSVLEHIEHAIQTLYLDGARTIVVFDIFPRGCYPDQMSRTNGPDDRTEDGCYLPAMKVIETHNAGLREMVGRLNDQLPGANVIVFSLFDMFMSAIRNPLKFGLKYTHKSCCGYGGGEYNFDLYIKCSEERIIDGELRKANVCENRSEYMMWDAIHPTDAFTFHIAQAFLHGRHMEPPFFIKEMCWLQL